MVSQKSSTNAGYPENYGLCAQEIIEVPVGINYRIERLQYIIHEDLHITNVIDQKINVQEDTLNNILKRNGRSQYSCMKSTDYCRFFKTILKTFIRTDRLVPPFLLDEIHRTVNLRFIISSTCDKIHVVDVPGNSNCLIYAFCTSLKINSN